MHRQKGIGNTPREIVEEIMRLHVEEGYTYVQLAEKYNKPFKTVQNMVYNEYKKRREFLTYGKFPGSHGCLINPPEERYTHLQQGNRRLSMENSLLRDFIHAIGRR